MVPQHYPIEPGILFAGEYPGDQDLGIARKKLLGLVEIGVRTFVDLTAPEDGLAPYGDLLAELNVEAGASLQRIAMPVPDMSVPRSEADMQMIMDAVRIAAAEAPAVYIHCWGGIGRTGTIVGCWLREQGLSSDAALNRVQTLYAKHMPKAMGGKSPSYPKSPQTQEQENYIRRWKS